MNRAFSYISVYQSISNQIYFFKSLFIFREGGREGEREGEKHQCVRETSTDWLSYVPWLGTKLATQARALAGNQTSDLLSFWMTSTQLSHTGQGWFCFVF